MKPTSVFLGSSLLATGFCGEQWWSAAMLCPQCGEVWGRVVRANTQWVGRHGLCPKHGGGSFLLDVIWSGSSGCVETAWKQGEKFLHANPKFLRHEFEVVMKRSGV